MALTLALVALGVGIGMALVLVYNRLVGLRNKVADAWAGIDVQLTRRSDLVPNLVAVVEAHRLHEERTLREVTEARAAARAASSPASAGEAEHRLGQQVGSLLAVAEAYPELTADRSFLELQEQLAGIEEELSFARRYYNAVVRDYNTAQQTFPTTLVSRPAGFAPAEYFQADLDARSVPTARA